MKIWRCHKQFLSDIISKIRRLIKKYSMKIEYCWVKREQNSVADEAAGRAREHKGNIVLKDEEKKMDSVSTLQEGTSLGQVSPRAAIGENAARLPTRVEWVDSSADRGCWDD